MRDPHSRIRRVNRLAARARGAERVYAEVLGVDLNIHLVGFGHNDNCDGGGMNASLSFGSRYALHPMHAALVLQAAINPFPADQRDHLVKSTDGRLAQRSDFHTPSMFF